MTTEFLKEPVIAALNEAGKPLKAKEIARALDVTVTDYLPFRRFLRELLAADGVIQRMAVSAHRDLALVCSAL